jgi:hypothetical protein
MISRRRRTKPARIDFREIVADRTENDPLFDVSDCGNEALEIGFRRTHQVKRETLRRLLPDAGQSF